MAITNRKVSNAITLRIGEKAQKFVLEEKTVVSQTRKIIELIKEI